MKRNSLYGLLLAASVLIGQAASARQSSCDETMSASGIQWSFSCIGDHNDDDSFVLVAGQRQDDQIAVCMELNGKVTFGPQQLTVKTVNDSDPHYNFVIADGSLTDDVVLSVPMDFETRFRPRTATQPWRPDFIGYIGSKTRKSRNSVPGDLFGDSLYGIGCYQRPK